MTDNNTPNFDPTARDIEDAELSSDIPAELHPVLARFYRFWNVYIGTDINEAEEVQIDHALRKFGNADLIKAWKH